MCSPSCNDPERERKGPTLGSHRRMGGGLRNFPTLGRAAPSLLSLTSFYGPIFSLRWCVYRKECVTRSRQSWSYNIIPAFMNLGHLIEAILNTDKILDKQMGPLSSFSVTSSQPCVFYNPATSSLSYFLVLVLFCNVGKPSHMLSTRCSLSSILSPTQH